MPKVHVLFRKEELDRERLPGKAVLVVDVLFATSSIAAALAHGAAEVVPMLDGAAALAEAARRPPGTTVLSGELDAVTLDGFAHPTPLALAALDLRGRSVLYSTTNGTVALAKAAPAAHVYAAALLNGAAVVDHLERACGDATVLVVCSGSADHFNIEDFYGAGYLVSLLARSGRRELTDAARAARELHDRMEPLECLLQGRVGRMMQAFGLASEVEYAAQRGRLDVVPLLRAGALVAA
jgi:2-phosphosulfolactate phosphatase